MNSLCTVTGTEETECNLESQPSTQETLDPDYLPAVGEKNAQTSLKVHEQDAKENAVKTIKHIVRKQFALEMRIKEQEIETIDDNIRQTKLALDRIRACVLARYYGMSEVYRPPHNSWSNLRRSKRDSKQLRSLAKTRNSSSSNNISRGTSSSNLVKQNHQIPSDSKKFDEKFEDVNKSTMCTSLEVQDSKCLNINSGKSGMNCITSLNDHTYCSNVMSGQHQGNMCDSKLVNSQNSMDLIGNLSSSSSVTHSRTISNISAGYSEINQTTRNFIPVSHSNALTVLTDTKAKFAGPELPNTQSSNLVRISSQHVPTSTNSYIDTSQNIACASGSRFYVKKRVIIGNTSKYIPPDRREENDKSTHKWMVYVRGPPQDPNIDIYIKKVWFFLHPSYRPNDIVEVNKPPFHLTRRGWGEFPIRVQLHFIGSWNKRVDIIHELKLDKTYTGLQTLGAETVVDLEIDRKTFEDIGIPVPVDTQVVQDQSSVDVTRGSCDTISSQSDMTTLVTGYSTGSAMDNDKEMSSNIQVNKIKLEPPSLATSDPTSSQVDARFKIATKVFHVDDNLDQQLHILADKIPLIHSKKDPNFSFCAASISQYFEWPIGKQRASEWQRALKIRNEVRKACYSTNITTKEVMIWCRRNGYTPHGNLMMGADFNHCKVCGRLLELEETSEPAKPGICPGKVCLELKSCTLSSALEFLTQVEDKDKLIEDCQNFDEEDVEVDVIGIPVSKQTLQIQSNQQASVLSIPLTVEQLWIRDVCNEIGVSLRPEILDGVEVNAVECMLFSAAKQFIRQLMHTAVALSNDTSSSLDCKLLVPNHVNQAILNIPQCDFLTNAYLGVDNEKR